MKVESNNFVRLADVAIHDGQTSQATSKGARTAYAGRLRAMYAYGWDHGEAMRQQAAAIKRHALRSLPDLLELAEQRLTENGFTVLWARDAAEARQHILDIAQRHGTQSVIKSKSMVTEEIALNPALVSAGLRVVETDLGEYILQLNDEPPSHIVAPVIHKSKDEIRRIFQDKLDMPYIEDSESMVAFARQKLRQDFLSADMGITGANFVIAETGSLAVVMNEGNGRMVTSMPRVHVAVAGIEKVIESLEDYATLTQVLSRSAAGQQMAVYTNIINGPCVDGGPEHLYLIFVDNGRSNIYVDPRYYEALACIRCGACLNACPVYRSTGGHAYGWVYGGPIGAVITPLLTGLDQATPLPNASSLCGSCKQACPVDIDIPRMLLELRHDLVEQRQTDFRWTAGIKGWALVSASPRLFELAGQAARASLNLGADRLIPNPVSMWKNDRDFPGFAARSFRQQWRERQKKDSSREQ